MSISDQELSELLMAVGVAPPAGPEVFGIEFEDLEVDSLARTELASRIKSRFGVDVEDDLEPDTTPEGMRDLLRGAAA